MSEDRKRLRIQPLVIETRFRFGEKTTNGYLTNLSEEGAFLATDELVEVGRELLLHFDLPRQFGHVEAKAQVIWRTLEAGRHAEHLPCGLGLAFLELDPKAQTKFRIYINKFCALAEILEKDVG